MSGPGSRKITVPELEAALPVLSQLDAPVLRIGPAYEVLWANAAALENYGEPVGTCHRLSHGLEVPCFEVGEPCPLHEAEKTGACVSVTHAHTGSGLDSGVEPGMYRVSVIPIEGGGGLEFHIPLGEGVVRDPLMGLYRREFWREVVLREQALLQRQYLPFSLLFVDVDRFKGFNDRHGHATGDEVLHMIGAVVLGCSRRADVSGRYGGEELVVFLPNTRAPEAVGVAERIREGVEALRIIVPTGREKVTVSIGVSTVDATTPLGRAIEAADLAMLEAKAAGRNQVMESVSRADRD